MFGPTRTPIDLAAAGGEEPTTPSISGTAYPGETLTVAGGSGSRQWRVGGVAVDGETAATFVIRVTDVGLAIDCVVGEDTADAVTCWHLNDEPGTKGIWLANAGAMASIEPDVAATDAQAVYDWVDVSGGSLRATQATESARALLQVAETAGSNVLEFDGSNDGYTLSGDALTLAQNANYCYMIAAVEDTNPTGGSTTHPVCSLTINGAATARLTVYTRLSGNFYVAARQSDGDAAVSATTPQESGPNVITAEALFLDGFLNIRLNGEHEAQSAFPDTEASTDSASTSGFVGYVGAARSPIKLSALIILKHTAQLTAAQLARVERYAGLLIGKDIPLV